jgi:hypothetical protein
LEWEADISKTGKLDFLIDTGADISLIKSTKLLGEAVFDPNHKVRVRGVDGSIAQTHGVIEVGIQEGNFRVRFPFHLVNKQVDLVCDGILGRDFLQSTKANICYETKRITLEAVGYQVTREMIGVVAHQALAQLPKRAEVIVQLPVEKGEGAQGVIRTS